MRARWFLAGAVVALGAVVVAASAALAALEADSESDELADALLGADRRR